MIDSKEIAKNISDTLDEGYIFYDSFRKRFLKYAGVVVNNCDSRYVKECFYFYNFSTCNFRYCVNENNRITTDVIKFLKCKDIIYIGNKDIRKELNAKFICISNNKSDFSSFSNIYDYVENVICKKYITTVEF